MKRILPLIVLAASALLATANAGRAEGDGPAKDAPAEELAALVNEYYFLEDEEKARDLLYKIANRPDATIEAVAKILREDRRFPAAAGKGHFRRKVLLTLAEGPDERAEYSAYVPEKYDPKKKWPLIVSCHGTGMHGDHSVNFWKGFAEKHGVLIIAPTALKQVRGYAHSEFERMLHVDCLNDFKRRYNVDEDRIYLQGWSRGGHISWDLGAMRCDLFAAVQPVIGCPRRFNYRLLDKFLHVPLYVINGINKSPTPGVFGGNQEDPNLVDCALFGREVVEKLGYEAEFIFHEDAGHTFFGADCVRTMEKALTKKRPPYPEEFVFAARDVSSGRAYWLRMLQVDEKACKDPEGLKVPKDFERMTAVEKSRVRHKTLVKHRAFVEAKIDGQKIKIKTSNVKKLAVYLAPELIDFSETVRVYTNGKKVFGKKVEPSAKTMLELARSGAERSRLFAAVIEVKVR